MALSLISTNYPGASVNTFAADFPVTFVAGSQRVLFAYVSARGLQVSNPLIDFAKVRTTGYSPIADMNLVRRSTISNGTLLICTDIYIMRDAAMPAPGDYLLNVSAGTGNSITCGYALFGGCDQSYSPPGTNNENLSATSVSQSMAVTESGVIVGCWSGTGVTSTGAMSPTGDNTAVTEQLQAPNSQYSGANYFWAPGAGTYTHTWSGALNELNTMNMLFWRGDVPTVGSVSNNEPLSVFGDF